MTQAAADAPIAPPTLPDEPSPIIAPEGRPIVAAFFLGGALVSLAAILGLHRVGLEAVGFGIAALCALLCAWCLWFFRDPSRSIPADPDAVMCPADGRVVMITPAHPPQELGLTGDHLRIAVFMNVFNVHVNRAPVGGTVERTHHFPGKFFNAALDKASTDNERFSLLIRTPSGLRVGCVQIAGLVARRIVCRVAPGASLSPGQRYGMIRFGSRVDVYLPLSARPNVVVGQTVSAGSTILARLV